MNRYSGESFKGLVWCGRAGCGEGFAAGVRRAKAFLAVRYCVGTLRSRGPEWVDFVCLGWAC